jgi:hypothetical protein
MKLTDGKSKRNPWPAKVGITLRVMEFRHAERDGYHRSREHQLPRYAYGLVGSGGRVGAASAKRRWTAACSVSPRSS